MIPPPPPEPPVQQLKKHHTVPELREELSKQNLGNKSDLCLRLVKRNSGNVTEFEISKEFNCKELRMRLTKLGISCKNMNKKELSQEHLILFSYSV